MRKTPNVGDTVYSPKGKVPYLITSVEEHAESGIGARRWVRIRGVSATLAALRRRAGAKLIDFDISHWFDGSQ